MAETAQGGGGKSMAVREAVFPIKEKADACTGLSLLTDSCKDEQWDHPAS